MMENKHFFEGEIIDLLTYFLPNTFRMQKNIFSLQKSQEREEREKCERKSVR